ncbi:DNA recombination protein RmuC [Patescibacteria group bacterium]|nr:DNA recombination protein RmuC [Patescibacteria group bacterium]MBU4023040.1 DNA recombination protein RmuC [Patescibacteria group bacterium]
MSDALLIIVFILIAGGMTGAVLFFTRKKGDIDDKQNDSIRDLERRLTDLMSSQLKEIRGSVDGTSKAMHQQISSFTKETVHIREEMKQVQEAMKGISSFQEIFRSPKIRGQWGEVSLEHILSGYFPRELYQTQYLFETGTQVDAVLKLPDKKLVCIDAKFSLENYKKMIESESEKERTEFRKIFIEDTKKKIQDISSKYILPSENTLEWALMYIPAEAVYYEINMIKEIDLGEYARSKKIILTSPNTLLLALVAISHWHKDVQITRKTQDILKRLTKVQIDGKKLMDTFRKLGSHLKNAIGSYDDSEKRLSMFDDKVERLLDDSESPKEIEEGTIPSD